MVILLSGGLDSIVMAERERLRGALRAAITVDYGQAAVVQEIQSASSYCSIRGVAHRVVQVSIDASEMNIGSGRPGPRVVPGRNLLLIAAAIPEAVRIGAFSIGIGCTLADEESYSDCRPRFIDAVSVATRYGYGISVTAPLGQWTRRQVRAYAEEHGLADLSWSCYEPTPQGEQCGGCDSCQQ